MCFVKIGFPGCVDDNDTVQYFLDQRPVVGDEMKADCTDVCIVYEVTRCVHSLNDGSLTVYLAEKEDEATLERALRDVSLMWCKKAAEAEEKVAHLEAEVKRLKGIEEPE